MPASTRSLYTRLLAFLVAGSLSVAVGLVPTTASAEGSRGETRPAAAESGVRNPGDPIPDEYIVVLREGVDVQHVVADYRALGAGVNYVYKTALQGFAGRLPPGLVQQLRRDPRVVSVESDFVVAGADLITQQDPPSWGLDRVDQRQRPLDKAFSYTGAGEGVKVYVLDTGIRATHREFAGRVLPGFDAYGQGLEWTDCNGHGSHVAGTAVGESYGVAKAAHVVPVRMLRCDNTGTGSAFAAGLDWVLANHPAGTPGVMNLSLVWNASSAINGVIKNVVDAGIVVAAAAANDGGDACTRSPASSPEAITVAATSSNDSRASFSNYGTCVDVFAPGASIRSALGSSDTASGLMSGTSMATPHVAGSAAVLFAVDPQSDAYTISDRLLAAATPDVVSNEGPGSPNLLLYVDPEAGLQQVTDPEPEPEPEPEPTPEPVPGPDPVGTTPSMSHEVGCGEVTLTFQNPTNYAFAFDYRIADQEPTIERLPGLSDATIWEGPYIGQPFGPYYTVVDVPPGTSMQVPIAFGEGAHGGDVEVMYKLQQGAEQQWYLLPETVPVATTCESTTASADGDTAEGPVVATLDGSASKAGPRWTAQFHAQLSTPTVGASLEYRWRSQRGTAGGGSCVTDASGACELSAVVLPNRDGSVTMTLVSVDGRALDVIPERTLAR